MPLPPQAVDGDGARVFDVFNGDADGLCALVQLRLEQPVDSQLVTGLKRDIELLARVPARAGDRITVLDVSLERNRPALERALAAGATVRYFDHHHAGVIPDHPGLLAFINTAPEVCTSILVDRHLHGARRPWAVVAAYGDGLAASAERLARGTDLTAGELVALRHLGEAINHNAYGESLDDVLIAAQDLYRVMITYPDPRAMIAAEPLVVELQQRLDEDLALAAAITPLRDEPCGAVYVLPDAGWSRRVVGSFANQVASRDPTRASVVAIRDGQGDFRISVRAGATVATGADVLCRDFGGNGRAKAAGIDRLPAAEWDRFLARLSAW